MSELPQPVHPAVLNAMRGRPGSGVWLKTERGEVGAFDELARSVGLTALGEAWVEVDESHARWLVATLLHRDLAYGATLLSAHEAESIAAGFIDTFAGSKTRYATNQTDAPIGTPISWNPATQHTFDCGLAIIGPQGSAIYWVADED